MAINGNFGPIPLMCILNTKILPKRIPENFASFPGKFILCAKLSPKMNLVGFLKSDPLVMWQSVEILAPFHPRAHLTLPFWLKEFQKFFLFFGENLHCFQNWPENEFALIWSH